MQRRNPSPSLGRSRSGYTLVMFALLLPVLLGMLGLVIDCGLLMAAQRQVQNAADAAAMAAAMAKLSGQGDPQTVATTFVTQYNGLSNATLSTFNNPPARGPHAGSSFQGYYEVVITYPVTTLFMPVLGANFRNQSVQARAVAGYETVLDSFPVVGGGSSFPVGEVVGALDPRASSGLGLTVASGASLVVNGRIIVNSTAPVTGGGQIQAAVYNSVGSTVPGTFSPYPGTNAQPPLLLNQPPMGDPLINLPTPGGASSGVTNTTNNTATPLSGWSTQTLGYLVVDVNGNVVDVNGNQTSPQSPNSVDSNGTVQLYPGVYQSIQIMGGKVNFNPGAYILSPSPPPPPPPPPPPLYGIGGTVTGNEVLYVTGGIVTGSGVMFYNTGGNANPLVPAFDPSTGSPDYNDARQYDPNPNGINAPTSVDQSVFGGINIDGTTATITLSPIANAADPFNGVLIYQRRANTQTIKIITGGGNLSLTGTLYAKWAPFYITGGGTYPAQFIGGSMQVQPDPLSGPATLTLNWNVIPLRTFGRANEVFLVE
jgi:hypothetical protein